MLGSRLITRGVACPVAKELFWVGCQATVPTTQPPATSVDIDRCSLIVFIGITFPFDNPNIFGTAPGFPMEVTELLP